MKEIFKNKIYMALFVSDLISNFGDVLYYLALLNYAVLIPEKEIAISIITISESIPLFLSFILGNMADQSKNKVKKIIFTLGFRVIFYFELAFFMGLNARLWIVVLASLVNLISDILGMYENFLFMPILKRIISDDIREKAMSLKQSVSSAVTLFDQLIASILIIAISYRNLALLNSATFLCSLIIILIIKKKLYNVLNEKNIVKDEKAVLDVNDSSKKNLVKNIIKELKEAVNYLISIKELKITLLTIPIFNGLISIFIALVTLVISENSHILLVNQEVTLSVVVASMTLGDILGGFITIKFLSDVKIEKALKVMSGIFIVLFAFLYIHQIYVVLICLSVIMILCVALNVKMGALIYKKLPEEKLGTIFGGISTYFSAGDILFKLLFSAIVVLIPIKWIVFLFGVISILVYIYIIVFDRKGKDVRV